jgi:A/G-specific adenine glycosylase
LDSKLFKSLVKSFSKDLIAWYHINKRNLPWRRTNDPYKIWLSEIILQQTQIKQGLPYYQKFVNRFPNIFVLAQSSENEVLKLWEGLGYYSRARNLHKTAILIIRDYNGIFPTKYIDLINLPGIGDYTASAISSFSINEVNPVVDGNVYRFISRLLAIKTPVNTHKSLKEFKKITHQLISKNNPSDFNQAIMEYGALVCKPSSPNCENCVFKNNCCSFLNNKVYLFPIKKKKNITKIRNFNFLVIKSSINRTIIKKRTGNDIWKNLYQFPLFETDDPADKNDVLQKLKKNKNLDLSVSKLNLYRNKIFINKLSHQHIHCSFWIVQVKKINKNYVNITDLSSYPFPKPISNFLINYKW